MNRYYIFFIILLRCLTMPLQAMEEGMGILESATRKDSLSLLNLSFNKLSPSINTLEQSLEKTPFSGWGNITSELNRLPTDLKEFSVTKTIADYPGTIEATDNIDTLWGQDGFYEHWLFLLSRSKKINFETQLLNNYYLIASSPSKKYHVLVGEMNDQNRSIALEVITINGDIATVSQPQKIKELQGVNHLTDDDFVNCSVDIMITNEGKPFFIPGGMPNKKRFRAFIKDNQLTVVHSGKKQIFAVEPKYFSAAVSPSGGYVALLGEDILNKKERNNNAFIDIYTFTNNALQHVGKIVLEEDSKSAYINESEAYSVPRNTLFWGSFGIAAQAYNGDKAKFRVIPHPLTACYFSKNMATEKDTKTSNKPSVGAENAKPRSMIPIQKLPWYKLFANTVRPIIRSNYWNIVKTYAASGTVLGSIIGFKDKTLYAPLIGLTAGSLCGLAVAHLASKLCDTYAK